MDLTPRIPAVRTLLSALALLLVASAAQAFVGDIPAPEGARRVAYLDPATGSLIIQVIAAGLAAAGLAGKTYWHKIKSLFGGETSTDDGDGDLHVAEDDR